MIKINKKLLSVLSISLLVHVVALVILATVIVINIVTREEEIFEAPPVVQSITPPKKQYQVSLEKLKNKTSSAKLNPIAVTTISQVNIPSLDVVINPSTKVSVSVASNGLDNGFSSLGAGSNMNFKDMAEIKLFGIESTGQKFFILIDASANMLFDKRGGIPGYQYVKEKVVEVVDNLPPGVLFNVAFFDSRKVNVLHPEMLRASDQNKARLKAWIEPVNKERVTGAMKGNGDWDRSIEPLKGASTYIPRALNVAMKQKPDNIYLMTTGWGEMGNLYSLNDRENWGAILKSKHRYSDKDLDYYFNVQVPAWFKGSTLRNNYVNEQLTKINKKREEKGLPPKVLTPKERNEIAAKYKSLAELGLDPQKRQDFIAPPSINKDMIADYIENLAKEFYLKNDMKPPVLNTIGFFTRNPDDKTKEVEKSNESWLRSLARKLDGKFDDVRLAKNIIDEL